MLHRLLIVSALVFPAFAQDRVLVISGPTMGDYVLPLTKGLAGWYKVYPVVGGSTDNGVAKIDSWLGDRRWAVIVFNFGTDDMATDATGRHRIEIPRYESNLKVMAEKLKKTGAYLVWVETVPPPTGNPRLLPEDVAEYSRAARRALQDTPHVSMSLSFAGDPATGYDQLVRSILYRNGECIMTQ